MNNLDYFNFQNINDFKSNLNQPYSKKNIGTVWFYDTRTKLYYLINQISKRINLVLINNYNEVPNKRNGRGRGPTLKSYVIAGFIPQEFKMVGNDIFLKISISNFDENFPNFNIECDLNFSNPKNKYLSFRNKLLEDTHWHIKIDENFPKTWEDLIEKIAPVIEDNLNYLNNFLLNNSKSKMLNKGNFPLSLNQVLYGPPGTGKTYTTIEKSISIVNPEFDLKQDRNKIKVEYERLEKNGQIVFTTFHQSMSYEDFIEGIKPTTIKEKEEDEQSENAPEELKPIQYEIQDGIFKRVCQKAKGGALVDLDFDSLWKKFFDHLLANKEEVLFKSVSSDIKFEKGESTEDVLNVRFKRTTDDPNKEGIRLFHARKNSVKKIFDERLDASDPTINTRQEIEKLLSSGRSTIYNAVYNSFFEFNKLGEKFKSKKTKGNFVLIIDEINRGNVSQIFGELITLIEDDKRLGREEQLEVILPYSKKPFGVPANLYILGTMNTADRSVEALDAALRRRFSFEEMPPKVELLSPSMMLQRLWIRDQELDWKDPKWLRAEDDFLTLFKAKILDRKKYESLEKETVFENLSIQFTNVIDFDGINFEVILKGINKRIEKLLDKDHQIGHSYLINVFSIDHLKEAFQNKIIPLLQEYFFGDYGKIGLVLGQGFFENNMDSEVRFKTFFDYNDDGLGERKIFRLRDLRKMHNEDFKSAIFDLMN